MRGCRCWLDSTQKTGETGWRRRGLQVGVRRARPMRSTCRRASSVARRSRGTAASTSTRSLASADEQHQQARAAVGEAHKGDGRARRAHGDGCQPEVFSTRRFEPSASAISSRAGGRAKPSGDLNSWRGVVLALEDECRAVRPLGGPTQRLVRDAAHAARGAATGALPVQW